MTKADTTRLLSLIAAAYPNSRITASDLTVDLWHEMLSDIPDELVVAAAKRMIATNPYPPSIADIRRNAADAVDAANDVMDTTEAWGMLIRAVGACGYYNPQGAADRLPAEIWDIARDMGWQAICMSDESNVSTLRAQFERAWKARETRRRDRMLVPGVIQERVNAMFAMPGFDKALPPGWSE